MTNKEIITEARFNLKKQGIIKGTGEFIMDIKTGEEVEIPEEIHTYKTWQNLGYQVQKGEKSIAKIRIWKFIKRTNKNDKEEEKIFMTNAAFFTKSQTKAVA